MTPDVQHALQQVMLLSSSLLKVTGTKRQRAYMDMDILTFLSESH